MKRILVVKLSAIGDIVHCLPAVTALQNRYPEAEIDWLVEENNRMIIDRSSLRVHVLTINTRGMRAHVAWDTIRPMVQVVREMRSTRYDCAIDFQGLIKSAFLTYLSGAPRRIGFSRSALREPMAHFFYTERVTPRQVHIVDQLHDLVSPLGINTPQGACSLSASEEARHTVFTKLGPLSDYLVIHPGGGWPTKRWPLQHFYELARKMADHGISVVLSFAPGEAEGIGMQSDKRIRTVTTSLDELMALSAGARLFVGGDTGPLHLAAAMNIPVVALLGPTARERNGPVGNANSVIEHSLPCRPCYKRTKCPLGHWNCIQEISVEEVYQACLTRLSCIP